MSHAYRRRPVRGAKREADFYEPLNLKQEYSRVEVLGVEKVGARDAYAVRGFPTGDNPETLYFDTQSGLLLRKAIFNKTPLGNYWLTHRLRRLPRRLGG